MFSQNINKYQNHSNNRPPSGVTVGASNIHPLSQSTVTVDTILPHEADKSAPPCTTDSPHQTTPSNFQNLVFLQTTGSNIPTRLPKST